MVLKPITREGAQLAREWRNGWRQSLRTPILITKEMQDKFYDSLQDRNSRDRYWEVWEDAMLGLVGLTDIEFENRLAEISLFISPDRQRKGLGMQAVRCVLEEGFDRMNLHQILGEVFYSNPNFPFWVKVVKEYGGFATDLPSRKYWGGKYWDSYYFAIFQEGFEKVREVRIGGGCPDSGLRNRDDKHAGSNP